MSSKTKEDPVIREAAENSQNLAHAAGAVRGVLSGISSQGEPLVDFYGNPAKREIVAVATASVCREDIGKEAILLFEDGDPARPLLIGLVQPLAAPSAPGRKTVEVTMDGHRLLLTAQEEITLRCGEASITLTSGGKVLIKGTYLLSKATGPNRIKGGSVQLN